jgi:hypothetical protein
VCQAGDHCKGLLAGARSRARKQKVTFALDEAAFHARWNELGGRCAVSGLPFTNEQFPQALVRHPFRPSLDRIDPGGAYAWDNVKLVCVCANFSMNEWGLSTLVRLADAVLDQQRHTAIRSTLVAIWRARLEGRVQEALTVLPLLDEANARQYRRRIAGMRASMTLGREGRAAAGAKAWATRQRRIAAAADDGLQVSSQLAADADR